MIVVQYGLTGNRRAWDGAPGFYHIALIKGETCYRSYSVPKTGYQKEWYRKGAGHLTNFRLELIF